MFEIQGAQRALALEVTTRKPDLARLDVNYKSNCLANNLSGLIYDDQLLIHCGSRRAAPLNGR